MVNQQGAVLWFTGLSGSGKSTLSRMLEPELRKRGCNVEILDGDEVRENLSKGLGFSKDDRDTNVRRIGYVARLLARNGVIVMTAAISPYADVRRQCRAMAKNFVEIYTECSIGELCNRDVKGLYAKAVSGEIQNFTGISDPYEAPQGAVPIGDWAIPESSLPAEITVNSENQSPEESLEHILSYLEGQGLIPAVE